MVSRSSPSVLFSFPVNRLCKYILRLVCVLKYHSVYYRVERTMIHKTILRDENAFFICVVIATMRTENDSLIVRQAVLSRTGLAMTTELWTIDVIGRPSSLFEHAYIVQIGIGIENYTISYDRDQPNLRETRIYSRSGLSPPLCS